MICLRSTLLQHCTGLEYFEVAFALTLLASVLREELVFFQAASCRRLP